MEIEIERLEKVCIILAKAIENGRIDGLVEEVSLILHYIIDEKNN